MTMKLVCDVLINGVDTLKTITTVDTIDQGAFVKMKPGVGKPFLMFSTLPKSPIAADFEGAPIVSTDTAANNAAIAEMLANPAEYLARLTFA